MCVCAWVCVYVCKTFDLKRQLCMKTIRFASGVVSTNDWMVLSVEGLCTRTPYKWKKSIAHCVDELTSEKSQLQVITFQCEQSLQELFVLRVEQSHKESMVICVADWWSANKLRTLFCFYWAEGSKLDKNWSKFSHKLVKKRPGRALERGARDQMVPGQA